MQKVIIVTSSYHHKPRIIQSSNSLVTDKLNHQRLNIILDFSTWKVVRLLMAFSYSDPTCFTFSQPVKDKKTRREKERRVRPLKHIEVEIHFHCHYLITQFAAEPFDGMQSEDEVRERWKWRTIDVGSEQQARRIRQKQQTWIKHFSIEACEVCV